VNKAKIKTYIYIYIIIYCYLLFVDNMERLQYKNDNVKSCIEYLKKMLYDESISYKKKINDEEFFVPPPSKRRKKKEIKNITK
jgi:hypothetical protein